MTREVTLKFTQEIPQQYIEKRKPIEDVTKILLNEIRNSFNFNGNIEVVGAKEFE